MIKIIIMIILGIIIGVLTAFPISKIFIKRHKKKITEDSAEKILKQKETNFQTSSGKPVDLNFINDGKEVDLKKQVKDELVKTKIKEIREYKEEIKDVKKSKLKDIKEKLLIRKQKILLKKKPKKKAKKHAKNKRKN